MTPFAHLVGLPAEELLPAVLASLPAVRMALRARFGATPPADRSPISLTPPTSGAS